MNPIAWSARALALSIAFIQAMPAASLASEGTGRVEEFIGDHNTTANVFELALRAGDKSAVAVQPWSGSYWPLHSGSVANPYNEAGAAWLQNTTRKLKGVSGNYKHFEKRLFNLRKNIKKLSEETLNELAPSEKYDLYIGDYDFTFTRAVWESLMAQFARIGKLALWEGSCQGWATSSIYVPRPKNFIRVPSLDGKYLIPFYPDDLKALATVLWANSLVQDHTVLLGNRCKVRNPEFDNSNGKVLSETCAGVNPGDLHRILLEMTGVRKQSFIVNRVNNTQVWNQPIVSYELKYFNLVTGREGELRDSIVARAQYQDPFRNYRSGLASSLVGVALKIRYAAERGPKHRKQDSPEVDKIKTLSVHYDLELDPYNNIVGGEWISSEAEGGNNNDPDDEETGSAQPPPYPGFIWKFSTEHPVAFSIADADLPGDDPRKMDHMALLEASAKASAFRYRVFDRSGRNELRPQPISKVVNTLIQMSHHASGPQE